MAWQETCPVLERYSFIEEMLEGDESMAELCRRYGVSRKTGYKWRQRHELGGVAGLVNLPRVAKSLPHKTDVELERLIVKAKNARPGGPRPRDVAPCGRQEAARGPVNVAGHGRLASPDHAAALERDNREAAPGAEAGRRARGLRNQYLQADRAGAIRWAAELAFG